MASRRQLKRLLVRLERHQEKTRRLRRSLGKIKAQIATAPDFCLFTEMFEYARQKKLALRRQGLVYFIKCGDWVKIGKTSLDATARIGNLQTANPMALSIVGQLSEEKFTEEQLHTKFRAHHYRGEWYRMAPEIEAFIAEHCA